MTYENLDELTGKLKRAAIDAFMADTSLYYIDEAEDAYVEMFSGHKITRPDKSGKGGGDWTAGSKFDWTGLQQPAEQWLNNEREDRDWKQLFDSIRSTIDDHLKPWTDLPAPSGFTPQLSLMEGVASALSVEFVKRGGAITGAPGDLDRYLDTIDDNLQYMSGGLIDAFTIEFLRPLNDTIAAHHDIAVVLGEAVAAEKNIWATTRESVPAIVAKATTAFQTYAELDAESGEVSTVLKVIGAAVGGALAFASAAAAGPVGATVATYIVASGVVTSLTALAEHQEKAQQEEAKRKDDAAKNLLDPQRRDWEGLMKGFGQCLDKLNDAVYAEEEIVVEHLKTTLTTINGAGKGGVFDLVEPLNGVDDDSDLHLAGDPAIILSRSHVKQITDKAMPRVAQELEAARERLDGAFGAEAFDHDGDVGYGHNGCYPQWSDLLWLLGQLVGDLGWEVKNGAATLRLAIEDMGRTDTDAADALERHATRIEGGSPYDPRDPEEVRDEARKYGAY